VVSHVCKLQTVVAIVYGRSGVISRRRTSRLGQNRFSLNLVLVRAINRQNKIFLVKPVEIKCQYLCVCVFLLNECHKVASKPKNVINLLAMVQEFIFIYTSRYILLQYPLLKLRSSKRFAFTLNTNFL